jgi:hypothetical protein
MTDSSKQLNANNEDNSPRITWHKGLPKGHYLLSMPPVAFSLGSRLSSETSPKNTDSQQESTTAESDTHRTETKNNFDNSSI